MGCAVFCIAACVSAKAALCNTAVFGFHGKKCSHPQNLGPLIIIRYWGKAPGGIAGRVQIKSIFCLRPHAKKDRACRHKHPRTFYPKRPAAVELFHRLSITNLMRAAPAAAASFTKSLQHFLSPFATLCANLVRQLDLCSAFRPVTHVAAAASNANS